MAPDDLDQMTVYLAKKLCADCPVIADCAAYAEQLTTTFGADFTQGVWAGLTLGERNTMAGLGIIPMPCRHCGMTCVPIRYAEDRCRMCAPEVGIAYADYRPQIEALLAAGLTYDQVAVKLRLGKHSVVAACSRWKIKSPNAAKRGRRVSKECGTMAARARHRRRGESWDDCACRNASKKADAERAQSLRELKVD